MNREENKSSFQKELRMNVAKNNNHKVADAL